MGQAGAITGGASGFGRAIADDLAARGWDVALFDVDDERVRAAADEVAGAHGVEAVSARVDVSSSVDLAAAAALVDERFGRCDLVWANVGVQHFGSVESTDEDVWRWVLDVNVVGAARTVQAFLPLVRRAERGHVAFTASVNALAESARLGAYQASKHAVVGLAETLRMELADEPIDVTVVYPAGMFTRHLVSSALARPAELGSGEVATEDIEAMMASRPMVEADLVTPEVAAAAAVEAVLAGEPHVITHGVVRPAVEAHNAAIERALARLDD